MLDPGLWDHAASLGAPSAFPHWHAASLHFDKETPVDLVTAGVYGEVLGGHYGRTMVVGNRGKMKVLSRFLAGNHSDAPFDPEISYGLLTHYLHLNMIHKPWYLRESFWREAPDFAEVTRSAVRKTLCTYRDRGIRTDHQAIEAFLAEHRGGQSINRRLLTLRNRRHLFAPFADPKLLATCTAMSFQSRIHNRLTLKLLKRAMPQLLNYPTSAVPIPVSTPLLLQEASRVARKVYELFRWSLYNRTKGRCPPPYLDWANFEFLRGSGRLQELVGLLDGDIFDKEALLRTLDNNESFRTPGSMLPLAMQIFQIYGAGLQLRRNGLE
jgi:hypothetical protein